jgi:hypothetical protein
MGRFENRANLHGELLATIRALAKANAGFAQIIMLAAYRAAMRANWTFRPQNAFEMRESRGFIVKARRGHCGNARHVLDSYCEIKPSTSAMVCQLRNRQKLDVFESEIHARLSELEGIESEIEWRKHARHQAACEFASSFNETCRLMFAFRSASAAASASEIGRKFGLMTEPAPLIMSGEALQKFLRETEMMSDLENARRRAAVDRCTQDD